jgi:hypothetical protein
MQPFDFEFLSFIATHKKLDTPCALVQAKFLTSIIKDPLWMSAVISAFMKLVNRFILIPAFELYVLQFSGDLLQEYLTLINPHLKTLRAEKSSPQFKSPTKLHPLNRSIELETYLNSDIKSLPKLPPLTYNRRGGKDPNAVRKAIIIHILKKLATCFTIRDKLMA